MLKSNLNCITRLRREKKIEKKRSLFLIWNRLILKLLKFIRKRKSKRKLKKDSDLDIRLIISLLRGYRDSEEWIIKLLKMLSMRWLRKRTTLNKELKRLINK